MNNSTLLAIFFSFLLVACGYGREDDKEAHRREELQEQSEYMSNSMTTLSSLKVQVRDSLNRYAGEEDSLARVKSDKYRLLLNELDQAENTYQDWRQEVEYEPTNLSHEEAMLYYDNEEEKAKSIQQDIEKTIEYVREEIRN